MVGDCLDDVDLRVEVAVMLVIMQKPADYQLASKVRIKSGHLQSRPHATPASWEVLEVRNDDAAVDHIMTLKTHALTTALRLDINDRVVVDTKENLIANSLRKAHGCGFVSADIASKPASVLIVSVDEVERVEEVGRVELLIEFISFDEAESKRYASQVSKERHDCSECLW